MEPGEPRPMRELATLLACDNSNVTGIIDRLEADLVGFFRYYCGAWQQALSIRRGIPAGRLLSASMQAPTGDLPEAAQRCFNPLSRLRAKYRRRRERDFCIPVCSYGA